MEAPERAVTLSPRAGAHRVEPAGQETLFGLAVDRAPSPPTGPSAGAPDYSAIRDDPEFGELRRRTLTFALPATVLFMANYLLFVLLSAFAPEFMGTPVLGSVNAGLLIGLFQFVTTMVLVLSYGRYARTRLDPLADDIRDEVESP